MLNIQNQTTKPRGLQQTMVPAITTVQQSISEPFDSQVRTEGQFIAASENQEQDASELYDRAKSILVECRNVASHSDLETAISLFREVIAQLPKSHPLRFHARGDLASALFMKFSLTSQREDLREAVSLIENTHDVHGPNENQPQLELEGVTPDSILDSTDLGNLENLKLALSAITTYTQPAEPSSVDNATFLHREAHRLHSPGINKEWLTIVEDLRALDGFQEFLRPSPFSALQRGADGVPVVALNASKNGCDALVLTPSNIQHVPLSNLTFSEVQAFAMFTREAATSKSGNITLPEETRGQLQDLVGQIPADLDALQSLEQGSMSRGGGRTNSFSCDIVLEAILAKLWTSAVEPVIRSLKLDKSEPPVHVRWCPTGPFAFLPIHASGIYASGKAESALDYIVSSYTLTIGALNHKSPSIPRSPKVMTVIQPEGPDVDGFEALPYTALELEKIKRHVPEERLIMLGTPEAPASVENVVMHLPEVSIVHFACHGEQAKNPLSSALILQDGRLTISQIMQQSLPNASLAVLSACQTATGDKAFPDESMHLAASLLSAGFPSVVATMWSIRDIDGPEIADAFYEHLFSQLNASKSDSENPLSNQPSSDHSQSAQALQAAVNKLRAELKNKSFLRWVPFIHLGL